MNYLFSTSAYPKPESFTEKLCENTLNNWEPYCKLDPIGSIIGGLAVTALMKNSSPKMIIQNNRLTSLTPTDSTSKWVPSILNPSGLPNMLQMGFQTLDRKWSNDTRQSLIFFNYALPYFNKLYPTSSSNENQNIVITKIWNIALEGINELELSYKDKLTKPINKQKIILPSLSLETESTMMNTFSAWRKAINNYLLPQNFHAQVESPPSIHELSTGIIQSPSNASSNTRPKKKGGKEENLKEELSLNTILSDLQSLIKLQSHEKLNNQESRNIHDLKKIFDAIQNQGIVPQKLHPLSEKLKQIWTLEEIEKFCTKIEHLTLESNPEKQKGNLISLNQELDEKAREYYKIVENEISEVLTL